MNDIVVVELGASDMVVRLSVRKLRPCGLSDHLSAFVDARDDDWRPAGAVRTEIDVCVDQVRVVSLL